MPTFPRQLGALQNLQNRGRVNPLPRQGLKPLTTNQLNNTNLSNVPVPDSEGDLTPEEQALIDQSKEKFFDTLGTAGTVIQSASLRDDGQSNVGLGGVGGTLSGLSQGAAFGPLGLIGGALLGGASAVAAGAQSNADFYDQKAQSDRFNLSSKTYQPNIGGFGTGGFMVGNEEFVPVQMELDENYVTPDLNIYTSKAKDTHENMDDDFVSDLAQSGSFAFSNRTEFTPETYADKVLGQGFAHYTEEGSFDLEEVKMSDVFGDSKKSITFSEGAEMIKKEFKTFDDGNRNADIFTKITNQENKQGRIPWINNLVSLHEGERLATDTNNPRKFMGGGGIFGDRQKELERILAESSSDNILNRDNSLFQSDSLFKGINVRNGLSALAGGISIGLQNTTVEPVLETTRFIDQRFEEVSGAATDQLAGQGLASANSLISNIARTDPRRAAQLAPRLFDSALGQSNQIQANASRENRQQRRARASELTRIDNRNNASSIAARDRSRSLINQKINAFTNNFTGALNNKNQTAINQFGFNRGVEGEFNSNRLSILNQQQNLASLGANFDIRTASQEERNRLLEEAFIKQRNRDNPAVSLLPRPVPSLFNTNSF